MALLDEIQKWATQELKPWQSDAVRRLFQKIELEDNDFNELLLMLKASRGLRVADSQAPTPVPLTAEHLPLSGAVSEPVVLEALHSLSHVNKIAPGQRLIFSNRGITVVFGENGAGKSGYSRVIKNACRARVKDEPVLPNAALDPFLQDTPSAVFVIQKGGQRVEVPWNADVPPSKDLASVAIFDSKCARAYTDQEGELIFSPWGLDVLENLARVVFPKLDALIAAEQGLLSTSDVTFDDLKGGNTAVSRFLKALTHATTDAVIQSALQYTDEDAARLKLLETALAEKSPVERARELKEQAQRVAALTQACIAAREPIFDDALQRLQQLDEDLVSAVDSETAAAALLRGGEGLLGGTGESAWRQMFIAAQAFVTQHEHPLNEGSPCPLCQTPFSAVAEDRVRRFSEFVANDASQKAASARQHHQTAFNTLASQKVQLNLDLTTVSYVEGQEPAWAELLQQFKDQLQARHAWILETARHSHDWSAPPALLASPMDATNQIEKRLLEQAQTLLNASDTANRQQLEVEKSELLARASLSSRGESLQALVAAKRSYQALSTCREDLKTKPVSDKAGSLASAAVTKQLQDALNEEFRSLNVSHLHASLKARNDKGKTKLKLVLDLPGAQKPEKVLSEGEQRVIAIGSFFAELRVSQHRGTAVFDDPVSSLDHQRRISVARRLVEEAQRRQVVVFTHDTVFLAELNVEIERTGALHAHQHLTYSPKNSGIVNEGLPWRHLKTKDRIDKLEKQTRSYEEDEPTLDNEAAEARARDIYGNLREVIERSIEEVVFSGVLSRYNDYIRVPNIMQTTGLTEAECEPIVQLYTRVSDAIKGHDKSAARAVAAPSAAEAKRDVETLKAALEAIRARRRAQLQNA